MNDHHLTPNWLIHALRIEFGRFDLDPCADDKAYNWFAKRNYTSLNCYNGLEDRWFGKVFVNPPYSQGNIPKWLDKAFRELKNCELIVMLLPCDTSTKWFHHYFCREIKQEEYKYYIFKPNNHIKIRFLNRINFSSSKHSARFPSMLVILRNDNVVEQHY